MNKFQVRINQATTNHATTSLQPGEIPGGGNRIYFYNLSGIKLLEAIL